MYYTALLYRTLRTLSALAFIAGAVTAVSAQSPKSEAAADIAALLKKHDAAMNQHDLNGVTQLYAKGPRS